MFILSSISDALEFSSVYGALIYENFELKVSKNIKFLSEIFSNWSNDFQEQMYTGLLNLADNRCCQYHNGLALLQ